MPNSLLTIVTIAVFNSTVALNRFEGTLSLERHLEVSPPGKQVVALREVGLKGLLLIIMDSIHLFQVLVRHLKLFRLKPRLRKRPLAAHQLVFNGEVDSTSCSNGSLHKLKTLARVLRVV